MEACRSQNSSFSREQTRAHTCAVGVPRCLCRHWTHVSPHEEPSTGPGSGGGSVSPQRGRAPPGRSQVTFSASRLKGKTANGSPLSAERKVPFGSLSGLATASLQLPSIYSPEDPLPFLQDLQVQAHSRFKPKAKNHLHPELCQHFTDASFGTFPSHTVSLMLCAYTVSPETPSSLAEKPGNNPYLTVSRTVCVCAHALGTVTALPKPVE